MITLHVTNRIAISEWENLARQGNTHFCRFAENRPGDYRAGVRRRDAEETASSLGFCDGIARNFTELTYIGLRRYRDAGFIRDSEVRSAGALNFTND